MQTVYANLETLSWEVVNNTTVNPVPADAFSVIAWAGGMTTQIRGAKPYAGALAHPPALPLAAGTAFYTLSYSMIFPGVALSQAQVFEFDLMLSGPDGSVANGSCQCNVEEGFMWQIATPGGAWRDTGFETVLHPNVWNSVAIQFLASWSAKNMSALLLTVNGTNFVIPPALKNVPFQPLNWAPNLIVAQRQLVVGANGGAFSVDDKGITVMQS
jgi:hypothetical protein